MAKLVKKIKVQATGGKATPAPPLGPVLGQAGINISAFVNEFNEKTRERMGEVVPVVISVSRRILKAIGKDKASTKPGIQKGGTITQDQIREIAQIKMEDLNAASLEAAMKTISGTARSMGIEVTE